MIQEVEYLKGEGGPAEADGAGVALVTGANGFIGVKVVERLLERKGVLVRCLVRPSGAMERLEAVISKGSARDKIEVVRGDLLSAEVCREAARGVSVIYHLAAGFEKSFAGAFMNSVLATRNLMDAFLEVGVPERFVNVSSFAVYSDPGTGRGEEMDEGCPLEDAPQERYDPYGFGKLKQEELVREYGERRGLPFVVLRPGAVFGPGKRELSGRVAIRTFGFLLQVGGRHLVPLTYVDNCAEAIVLAGIEPGVNGETFNVVDDELPTAREFLRMFRRKTGRGWHLRVPYWAAYWFCGWWESYSKATQGQLPPVFNRRRCEAEWKPRRYSNRKLRQGLGWSPRFGLKEGMEKFLEQFSGETGGK